MAVDADWNVVQFAEKPRDPAHMPGRPDVALASMGIYVFATDFLIEELTRDAADVQSNHDFGRNILPGAVGRCKVGAYAFRDASGNAKGYWRDVGTVDSYWQANMELIEVEPELNLYDRDWPIWTYQEQLPPAKFVFDDPDRRGVALNSMVSGGCIIAGSAVKRSLLFPNVHIEPHSEIDESVVLPNVRIGRSCRIRRTVLDKGCMVPAQFMIGHDRERDARLFHVTPGGITLVTPDMLGQALHTSE
jgi:glucose-1-phosphate adenylyltransferase